MALLRVHRCASVDFGEERDSLTVKLKALVDRRNFPRHAWVNLWEVPSTHQYRLLPSAPVSELRSMVRRHAATTMGVDDAELVISSKIGHQRSEMGQLARTEVSFFAARSRDIEVAIKPIVDAGFIVDGVTTPCGALWSLARVLPTSFPGDVRAFVALGRSRSALSIFSSGLMLYGRDLDWGFASTSQGDPVAFDREGCAGNLALELRRSFLYVKQFWEGDVSRVLLCGDMPVLRSMTAPLIEQLNIEVETLDTLEGIETHGLPEGLAEQVSAFRLAVAIAGEPSPANLLPAPTSPPVAASRTRSILAAAASLALIVMIYALVGARTSSQPGVVRGVGHVALPPGEPAEGMPASDTAPAAMAVPRPGLDVQPGASREAGAPQTPKWSEPMAAVAPRGVSAARENAASEPVPVLRGVLVSEGRRLAIIDGRVLSLGDRVASFVIRSIESDAVVLEGAAGRTRLEMSRPSARVVRP